ncbi:hypothetical protein A6770_04010 [Nostoc minutum NIES-26]|uniref:histidine kinase n=1 Tax=Nostoc minutum NIES-26 TaxID=1844469 RepID=A0A367QL64_9NOSO|nr:hypothetical protein A6770_04010 [Nostoc minutum NIES-26]
MQALPQLLWLRCLKSIIDCSPLTVEPETSVSDVISLMAKWDVNVLVISVSQLIGWFTAQDVVQLLASGVDFKTTKISEVMQPSAIALKLSDFNNMTTVLALLRQHQLDLLPIIDEQGQPIGIVTHESICRVLEQPVEVITGECSQNDINISEFRHVKTSMQQVNQELERRVTQRTIALEAINRQLLSEISDRQIIEEQLQQSQQVLQLIMNTIPQCIFWKDRNSVFLGCNRNFAKMVGFDSPEDIVGKTDYDLPCKKEDADLYRECDARVMQTNTPEYYIIEPLLKADGKQIWLETNKVPLHDGEGNVVGILGTFEDITEYKQAQDALEKSEERFRFLAESIPQQAWIAQANGNTEYVNQPTLDYFACTQEEILDWGWQKWIHPEDLPNCIVSWQNSLATGEPLEIEYRCLRAIDKTYRWHLVRALPLRDRQGKIVNWFGTNTDIDDRVSAEIALRESEQRYQTIASVSPVGIFCTDAMGDCFYVNERWCKIAGLTKAAGIGRSWIAAIHPEDLERVASEWNQAVAGKRPFRLEYRYQRPDGGVTWVFGQVVVETTDVGEVKAYVGTITDISQQQAVLRELRQTEAALRHSEERFRNLVEASSDWVWEVDENTVYTYVSPKVRDILGYEPQAVLGKTPFDLMPPEEAERVGKVFAKITAAQEPFKCLEKINICKDNHLVVLETSGVPVFDVAGKFRGYRGMDRDITARKRAEAALRDTQQQLQAILDNSPAVIYVVDAHNRYLLVNHKFERLFKITQDQIVSKSIYEIWSHDIADGFAAKNCQVIAEGISVEAEEVVTQEDRLHTYLSINFPLKDANDIPYAVCGISTDITDRKLAQDSLLRFRKAIESTSDAIAIGDITGTTIYVNPAYIELYEYTLEELQAAGGSGVIFQQPGEQEKIFTTVQSGKSWRGEVTMRSRSGHMVQIYLSADAIKDTTGKMIGTVSIHTDITQRRQAEIALLVSQQQLQYLLSSSPAVIYTAKTFGDFGGTFVSENVNVILGYEAQEMIEDSSFWASHIHPEDVPHVSAALVKVFQQGQYKLEYRFLHKDGTYRWIYNQGKLVRDDTGNPLELVGYMADITDRKQLEQELRLSLEKEKELSKLKSRFVSMTSHEFRTPLSTILSSSELLEHYRHKWSEEKQLTHLHRIQTGVKRMTEILNDILIVGKVEAGKLEFRPKSFDLVAYCRHLIEETQLNLSNKQVTDFISQYESMPCYMDDKLLEHILGNLLSNAIKYSPINCTIKFTLTCQHGQVIFEIQDWGIGIPPEDIPHLFESFYRANNVGNILGTGLGLAIVKRCVDIHKGEIFVTSKLGISTLFTVILPLNN